MRKPSAKKAARMAKRNVKIRRKHKKIRAKREERRKKIEAGTFGLDPLAGVDDE